jgi:hypothetical protein
MVLVIKKGASKKELINIEEKLQKKNRGFDSDKYNGVIKFKKDGLSIQNDLRDEWERTVDRH